MHPGERRIVAADADPGRGGPNGAAENRFTVSMYASSWHHASSSSGAGSGASPGSAPTAPSRSSPGPNRRGVSGWLGPKS